MSFEWIIQSVHVHVWHADLEQNVYAKVTNRFWIKPRFSDFQQHGNKIKKFFKISTKFNTETLCMF